MDPLLEYFTRTNSMGIVVVQEAPRFDLDSYIQNYRGRTRHDRLMHIGRCCVPLALEALRAAVAEAKRGKNVFRYREAVDHLCAAAPSDPDAVLDQAWIDRTNKVNKDETQRLEAELKGYKNNMVRESIRIGHEDLAKHLEEIGDPGAAGMYSQMRSDAASSKHLIDVGKHLIRLNLAQGDMTMLAVNLAKTGALLHGRSGEGDPTLRSFLRISSGIAAMLQERFADAAISFLEVDTSLSAAAYRDITSPHDVAVYGVLLALATMDRKDLQVRVLDNSSFRSFLELEPHVRRAVTQFVNGRYAACLATLESYRTDYLLDIYLWKYVDRLYGEIRRKCIVHYIIPFSCVTLDSLDKAFAVSGASVEDELADMIRTGRLKAKINSVDRVVTTGTTNSRMQMQASTLETVRGYEKDAIELLRRMSLAAADLQVTRRKDSDPLGLLV